MDGSSSGPDTPPGVDTSVAHIARIQNYLRGGTDNFPADREAARQSIAAYPGLAASIRSNQAFLGRAVRYLAGQASYLDADLRDTARLLEQAAAGLDFSAPVAIMLVSVMHMVEDRDDPHAIVAALLDAVPAGSFLALTHVGSDLEPAATAEMTRRVNARVARRATPATTPRCSGCSAAWTWCRPASSGSRNGGRPPRRTPALRPPSGAVSAASAASAAGSRAARTGRTGHRRQTG